MTDDIVNLSALVVLREMSGFALGRRSGHGHGYDAVCGRARLRSRARGGELKTNR